MKNGGIQDKYFGGAQMIAGLTHVITDAKWDTRMSYSKSLRGGGDKKIKPGSAEPPSFESTTTSADITGS
jgi:hypothetical protein